MVQNVFLFQIFNFYHKHPSAQWILNKMQEKQFHSENSSTFCDTTPYSQKSTNV
jgi:hypothetical protein